MTKQCCDYIWYNNEKFVLIDCEKDKDIINSADFGLKNFSAMTCCYRGYTAEYFIDGELCELTDLSPAIQEYKALEDSLKHKFEKTREIAVKYLQYEYGNYKWG
ncbi:MAG: hypothetical protein HDT23_06420 [Ruminococcus sp.]|nr:hypothetical protein [Ruminococcus sp.]